MLRSCRSLEFRHAALFIPFRSRSVEQLRFSLHLHSTIARHASHSDITTPWQQRRDAPSVLRSIRFTRAFHASPRNEGLHLLVPFIGVFKSSVTIKFVLSAVRIALTLVPVALIGKRWSRKWIQKLDNKFKDNPDMQAYRPRVMRNMRYYSIAIRLLLFTPVVLFGLVVVASIERTPLTGRLRLIVLSASEEETIAHDLSGPGWFAAINDLLATPDGSPEFIPPTDWRYKWVERILRRLESVVPELQDTNRVDSTRFDQTVEDFPYPPPAKYPLVARPRMAQSLHYLEPRRVSSEHRDHHGMGDVPPRGVLGPPYSLLVYNQPDQSNALSYGFGPNGSGGIVIFSGFLERIMRNTGSMLSPEKPRPTSIPAFLAHIFSPTASSPAPPIPTPAQDTQLAVLLAHELAHLLLSHHLETLSSGNVFWPSLTSILTDLFRALLFPITMVGGPFINDALEQVGEVGKREFAAAADSCSSHYMEIEADIVSIRLLALAGWDPRSAADFWEELMKRNNLDCVGTQTQTQGSHAQPGTWFQHGDRQGHHPLDAVRVQKIREELARWEAERLRIRERAKG